MAITNETAEKRLRSKIGIASLGLIFTPDALATVRVADLRDVLDDLKRLRALAACTECDGRGTCTVPCPRCLGSGRADASPADGEVAA